MKPPEPSLQVEPTQSLKFERLLTEISARFVNLPVDKIDSEIEDAQRCICECLGLDLSALWQWTDDHSGFMTVTHLFSPPEGPERPEKINAAESFPWLFKQLLKGKTLVYSTDELPAAATQDKESRRYFGVKSSVNIPLQIAGESIIGVLTFDTLHHYRSWSEEIVGRLELISQVFSNALARRKSEVQLRESKTRLDLAAASAGAGFWDLDCSTRTFWATERARSIFDYGPDEVISMDRFEASVHPDDLNRVREVISLALNDGQPVNVEYRVRIGGDHERWVCSRGRPYFDDKGRPVRLIGVSLDFTDQKKMEIELQERLKEIESLKRRLENENLYLRKELRTEQGFERIVGESKPLQSAMVAARQVAATDATVLILGETGTGKGLFANAIHQMSDRKARPLVTVNCSALPLNLIESELFGREKGAFTGAHVRQAGRFEVADGGTIFLDEIGEMPLELQPKLLRVLQEGEFERLGSARPVSVDVRVIAATSRDLKEDVRAGRFRADLFYRLNVFPIPLPPLRERVEDIPLLAQHFAVKYTEKMKKPIDAIPKNVVSKLSDYSWPGNVRELEHVIERGVVTTSGSTFQLNDPLTCDPAGDSNGQRLKDLAEVERSHILDILQRTGWKIEGPSGAAAILKLHPSTLRFRIKKLDIRRPS